VSYDPAGDIATQDREDTENAVREQRLILGVLIPGARPDKVEPNHPSDFGVSLRPEWFYHPKDRVALEAVLHLQADGQTTDALSVVERLRQTGKLDVCPEEHVFGLARGAVYPIHNLVDRVIEAYRRRRLRELIHQRHVNIRTMPSTAVFVKDLESDIQNIMGEDAEEGDFAADAMQAVMEELAKRESGQLRQEVRGLTTGFFDLDGFTTLKPGEMIIVAARPSVGKTTMGTNLALHLAQSDRSVLIYSIETDTRTMQNSIAAAASGVPHHKFDNGEFNHDDVKAIKRIIPTIGGRIAIQHKNPMSPAEVMMHARTHQRTSGMDVLIVDYLQLLDIRDGRKHRVENRQLEVAEISRSLKRIATQLKVPVIAMAQLNREVESRADGKPRLSDLRESGAIEQDADVIILLGVRKGSDEGPTKLIDCYVAKNRNGSVGMFTLVLDGPRRRLTAYTSKPESMEYHR